jgi:transcriptional regulator with XRE-family HTH domain
MTPTDLQRVQDQLQISRSELCRRLGIAKNTGTAYAFGRAPIPLTVALACAALMAGLDPIGTKPAA